MMTFSFRPASGSTLPLMAASVRTRVVSWKEAADRKESVAKLDLVIPSRTWLAWTSFRSVSPASMRAWISSFLIMTSRRFTMLPIIKSLEP